MSIYQMRFNRSINYNKIHNVYVIISNMLYNRHTGVRKYPDAKAKGQNNFIVLLL